MFRPPVPLLAAGLLLAPLFAPPALAQDNTRALPKTGGDAADPFVADAARLIPADAGVVIRIADPDSAVTHLTDFVREAAPQYANRMFAARGVLGFAVRNATLSGVNMKEPWYLVAIPRADQPPATVFLLPAANVQAMQEGVGPGMQFKTIGTYAAYTDAGEEALEGFGEGGKFAASLPQGTVELAGQSDITLAVNVPRLLEVYGDDLEGRLDDVRDRLKQQSPSPEAAANQQKALDLLVQAAQDSGPTVVGLAASKEKLWFKKIAAVKSGSQVAGALATQQPAEFALLDKLPEGLHGYAIAEGDLKPLVALMRPMQGQGEPEPFETLVASLADAGAKAVAGGFLLGGEGSLFNGVQVLSVKDAAAVKPAVERFAGASDGRVEGGVRTTVEQTGTVEVEGMTLQTYLTDLEVTDDAASDEAETAKAAVDGFHTAFGEDGQVQKVGYTEDMVLKVVGGGEKFAGEAVGHLQGMSGHTNEPLDQLRGMLPKKGNVFLALDLASVAQAGLAAALESGQIPPLFDADTVRDVSLESSYMALTVSLGKTTVTAEGVIPVAQVRNVMDLADALQGDAQGF